MLRPFPLPTPVLEMHMIGHAGEVRSGHHHVHASIRVGCLTNLLLVLMIVVIVGKFFDLRSYCVFQQSHKCVVVVGQSGHICVKLNWVLLLSSITNNET